MSKWRETIGNGFGTGKNKDTIRTIPVTDERDGAVGGYHVEHWDGSQDAHVIARAKDAMTVKAKVHGHD